jgi:hypothetical protein
MAPRNLVALALVVATGCTHDFSLFNVGQVGASSTGGTDASSGSGGSTATGGDGGALSSGGLPSGGGGQITGGTGGQITGGTGGTLSSGGSGGTATGGTPASGGGGGGSGAGGGAGGGTPDSGLPSCNSIYGTVAGYLLCVQTATTCRFLQVAATGAPSCTSVCAAHGGTCSSADNGDPGSCGVTGTATCATLFASSICVCSRQ